MTDQDWLLEFELPADGSNIPDANAKIRAGIFIGDSQVMSRRVSYKEQD